MSIVAHEVEVLAIEEESLFGIYIEGAKSCLLAHLVNDLVTIQQRNLYSVKVRILLALPQMRVLNGQWNICHIALCSNGFAADDVAHSILDLSLDLKVLAALERKEGLDVQIGLLCRNIALTNQYAGRSIEVGTNAVLFGDDKVAGTMDAAIDVEVTRNGQYIGAESIAGPHFEQVVALFHKVGDLVAEGQIATLVFSHDVSVDENRGHRIHSLEIEEKALSLHIGSDGECAVIHIHRTVIAHRAWNESYVPGMGQSDGLEGCLLGHFENGMITPAFVQADVLTILSAQVECHGAECR